MMKINRRRFAEMTALGAVAVCTLPAQAADPAVRLRLGGPVFEGADSPETWVAAIRKLGYRAAYCPVGPEASDETVRAYESAAQQADITIAEVGAWSNLLDRNEETRKQALEKNIACLALADRIGARCCVNISGSNGTTWHGPHPDDLTEATFDRIVETVRHIIDAVKPTRSFYALETMPWSYPISADSYLRLIQAIDRKGFAVHFDPVNLINSPERYFNTGAIIQECFEKLGPHLRSCHAKDITLSDRLTVHLDEILPGKGGMNYPVFLKELSKYPEVPLMLEHLSTPEEYDQAAEYVRSVGQEVGVTFA